MFRVVCGWRVVCGVLAQPCTCAFHILTGYGLHSIGVMNASARFAKALQSSHLGVRARVVSRGWFALFVGYRAHLVLSELGQLYHFVDSTARENLPGVEGLVEVRGGWARHYEAHLSGSGLVVCVMVWNWCGRVGWIGLVGLGGWCGWVGVALSRAIGGGEVCVVWWMVCSVSCVVRDLLGVVCGVWCFVLGSVFCVVCCV